MEDLVVQLLFPLGRWWISNEGRMGLGRWIIGEAKPPKVIKAKMDTPGIEAGGEPGCRG